MSDNTKQDDSAVIRTLARQGGNVETQAFALDLGGGSANPELLITAGQQSMAQSVPVVIAADQTPIPVTDSADPYRGASSYLSGVSGSMAIAAGARIVSLSATSMAGGTIQILGGVSIVLPPGTAFTDGYSGFTGPGNIVFTGTDSYYVAVNL